MFWREKACEDSGDSVCVTGRMWTFVFGSESVSLQTVCLTVWSFPVWAHTQSDTQTAASSYSRGMEECIELLSICFSQLSMLGLRSLCDSHYVTAVDHCIKCTEFLHVKLWFLTVFNGHLALILHGPIAVNKLPITNKQKQTTQRCDMFCLCQCFQQLSIIAWQSYLDISFIRQRGNWALFYASLETRDRAGNRKGINCLQRS